MVNEMAAVFFNKFLKNNKLIEKYSVKSDNEKLMR